MAGWVLRADTALLCRSTAQAAPELPAEEYFVKSLYPDLGLECPPPVPAATRDKSRVQTAKKETTEPAINL